MFARKVADLGDRLARQRAAPRGPAADLGDGAGGDSARAAANRDAAAAGRGMAYGMRMATELVAAVAVGGAIGIGLDKWLRTWPWLFLLFFLLGFVAGVVNVVRAYGRLAAQIAAARRDGDASAHQ